jgi:hypothetical protein
MAWLIQYIEVKEDWDSFHSDPHFSKDDLWDPKPVSYEQWKPRVLIDENKRDFALVFEGTRLEAVKKARESLMNNDGEMSHIKTVVIDIETGDTVYDSDEDITRILGLIQKGDKIGWWFTPYGSKIPEKRYGILWGSSSVSTSQPYKKLSVSYTPRHTRKGIRVDPFEVFERTRKGESPLSLELVNS